MMLAIQTLIHTHSTHQCTHTHTHTQPVLIDSVITHGQITAGVWINYGWDKRCVQAVKSQGHAPPEARIDLRDPAPH